VWTNFCCDWVTRSAADRLFSVFLRAMELISSLEADVSSSDAACSVEPCASDWLEEETWLAAEATCWAPSESSRMHCCKAPDILRATMTAAEPMTAKTSISAALKYQICWATASCREARWVLLRLTASSTIL